MNYYVTKNYIRRVAYEAKNMPEFPSNEKQSL